MKKAFTMIELIFVIIIIGVLSSIAVPKMLGLRTDAKFTKILEQVSTIRSGIENVSRSQMLASLDTADEDSVPSAKSVREWFDANKSKLSEIKADSDESTYKASLQGVSGEFVFKYHESGAQAGQFVCDSAPSAYDCSHFSN